METTTARNSLRHEPGERYRTVPECTRPMLVAAVAAKTGRLHALSFRSTVALPIHGVVFDIEVVLGTRVVLQASCKFSLVVVTHELGLSGNVG